jgi:hypothetical protein
MWTGRYWKILSALLRWGLGCGCMTACSRSHSNLPYLTAQSSAQAQVTGHRHRSQGTGPSELILRARLLLPLHGRRAGDILDAHQLPRQHDSPSARNQAWHCLHEQAKFQCMYAVRMPYQGRLTKPCPSLPIRHSLLKRR